MDEIGLDPMDKFAHFFCHGGSLAANILSRLPVKNLLQCKSVSKLWRSFISSPRFIKTHLCRSINNPYLSHHQLIFCDAPVVPQKYRRYVDFTVRGHENPKLMCFPLDNLLNRTGPKHITLHYPTEKNINNWTYIVDYCNGLVCLACIDGSVFLWNPSTRNCRRLPKYKHEHEHTVFGFGYNETQDDFKVYAFFGDNISVYSSNSNCWGMIEDVTIPSTSKGTFAHGAIHWVVVGQGDEKETIFAREKETIFALDVETHTCRKVSEPDYGKDVYKLTLGTLGTSLSVICQNERCADLWLAPEDGKKESWKKLFTFPFPNNLTWFPWIRPLCISAHGDFMLLVDSAVIMYNPKKKNNQIKPLFETESNPAYNMFEELNVYTYVESLVSP